MNFLLDTHTFLWFIGDNSELSQRAKSTIENREHEIFLSTASIWEMAIKVSLGKLVLPTPFPDFILSQISLNDFRSIDISVAHLGIVASLPFHHRDPFDRLLIAQAHVENQTIISRDTMFDLYSIRRIW